MPKLDLRKNKHPTGGREYKLSNISRSIITPRPDRDKRENFTFYRIFHLNLIPDPATNLTATVASETSVDVNWNPSIDNIDSYTLYVKNQSTGTLEQTIEDLVGTSTTVFGLTTGDTYQFWVVAIANLINSKPSNSDTAIPQDVTAPTIPTGLQEVSVTTTSIDISWDANTEADISLYRIYVNGVEHANSPVSHPTTTFTVDGLSPDTSYDITISAEDTNGNESNQSPVITSTTESEIFSFRYLRWTWRDNHGDSLTLCREFEIYNSVGGINQIANIAAIINSPPLNNPDELMNGVDDASEPGTYTLTSNLPVSIEIDLGSEIPIAEYGVGAGGTSNRRLRSWKLEGSNDQTNWTEMDDITNGNPPESSGITRFQVSK